MSLITKLGEIRDAVKYVQKDGKNSFHGYKYASEGAILEKIREELESKKVLCLVRCEKVDIISGVTEKGKPSHIATTNMVFTLIDAENENDRIEIPFVGMGEDSGDKAVYKAYTGAVKYFWLKNFQIETGDDPENDETVEKAKRELGGTEVEKGDPVKAEAAINGAKSVADLEKIQKNLDLRAWGEGIKADLISKIEVRKAEFNG